MKNKKLMVERERHQAQLQEEGIVWNQLKPVWKEKYWEEMLRGLRDDPTGSVKNMRRSNGKRSKIEG